MLRELVVPEGVCEIANHAFANCSALESVVFPESLKTIGARAFAGRRALREVVLPTPGVRIGPWAFNLGTSLRFGVPEGTVVSRSDTVSQCATEAHSVTPEAPVARRTVPTSEPLPASPAGSVPVAAKSPLNIKERLSNRRAGERLFIEIKGTKYGFCYCPPGKFMMGSPMDEVGRWKDEIQHEVKLTRSFWMLETPCTQQLWTDVTGDNPSKFKGYDLPVEQVTYDDCWEVLNKLNSLKTVQLEEEFRLPAEAEWEYACRAGTTTPYSWGGVERRNGEL